MMRLLNKNICSLVMLALSSYCFAQGDIAHLAGPSIVILGTKVTYNGSNFQPGTMIRVQTQENGATPYEAQLLVGENGAFVHEIEPRLEGVLVLSVIDASNNTTATANAVVMRSE